MYVFVFSVCRRRPLLLPSNPAIVISFHMILHEQCWKFQMLIANINGTQGQLWVRFLSFPAGRIKTGHNHCFIAFPNYVFQVSVVVVWSVKPCSVPCFHRKGIVTNLNTSDVYRNHSQFSRTQQIILFRINSLTCFRPNRPSKVGKNGR